MSAGVPEGAGRGAAAWRGLRRVLATLGLGVLATIAGSGAGGAWFALMAIALEGFHGLMASPGIVFFGLIFGPLYAAPITLGVLSAIRLWLPRRWQKKKSVVLLLAGPLTGSGYLWCILPREDDIGGDGLGVSRGRHAWWIGGGSDFSDFPAFTPDRAALKACLRDRRPPFRRRPHGGAGFGL